MLWFSLLSHKHLWLEMYSQVTAATTLTLDHQSLVHPWMQVNDSQIGKIPSKKSNLWCYICDSVVDDTTKCPQSLLGWRHKETHRKCINPPESEKLLFDWWRRLCWESLFQSVTEVTVDWQLGVNREATWDGCASQPAINQNASYGCMSSHFLPFTELKEQRKWTQSSSQLVPFLGFLASTSAHLVNLPSLFASVSDPLFITFSLLGHLFHYPLSSARSSQCKGILPWETVGPLSIDFWPAFQSDAKQATRTSQCDVMAGCPLNTRAGTKWDWQLCPCMHAYIIRIGWRMDQNVLYFAPCVHKNYYYFIANNIAQCRDASLLLPIINRF